MRLNFCFTISFFICQITFSQTEILHGKVFSVSLPIKNVEVINKNQKISTTTNDLGEFALSVNLNDSLLFFKAGYNFTRLKISTDDLQDNNLIINLSVQPLELNEIVISNKKLQTVTITKEEIEEIKLNKTRPKEELQIIGYKEAVIMNGTDFIILGKQIKKLINLDPPQKKEKIKIDFIEYINNNINPDFFLKELKQKSDEKQLFLNFCDADPKSKIILEQINILTAMDYLLEKNIEFKRLHTELKK